jgi:archaellum component FlaF (FlaF/FlaG flagellin family)
MFNDTTELNYRYEIAISEKNGKLIGYSQTFFILDGKEYYCVKKLKITIDGDKVITQDLKLIENNYPIKPPKGVYVVNVLNFEMKKDVMMLSGMFETNRTRQYAPATGYVHIERKIDVKESPLVKQLEKMGLMDELSFVPAEKPNEATAVVMPKTAVTETEQPMVKAKPVEKEKPAEVKVAKTKPVKEKTVAKEKEITKAKEVAETKEAIVKKEPETKAAPEVKPKQAAADINSRIIETIQSVNYSSDSLVISLYDNGEVDGDTVSVLMNGNVIMPLVSLSTNAVRKTIYTKDITDSIQIVMYAENLGALPPNTGLLIVYDGKERYEIRFSGDLKKNAAIVFRRKEK